MLSEMIKIRSEIPLTEGNQPSVFSDLTRRDVKTTQRSLQSHERATLSLQTPPNKGGPKERSASVHSRELAIAVCTEEVNRRGRHDEAEN